MKSLSRFIPHPSHSVLISQTPLLSIHSELVCGEMSLCCRLWETLSSSAAAAAALGRSEAAEREGGQEKGGRGGRWEVIALDCSWLHDWDKKNHKGGECSVGASGGYVCSWEHRLLFILLLWSVCSCWAERAGELSGTQRVYIFSFCSVYIIPAATNLWIYAHQLSPNKTHFPLVPRHPLASWKTCLGGDLAQGLELWLWLKLLIIRLITHSN